ncbi:MAG: SdpI family protein [Acidobacteriota bacterium]
MKFRRWAEWTQLGLVAAMFLAGSLAWTSAPDRIPIHWGADGTVDRYGGKLEGLLGLPAFALLLYLLLRYMPRIDPGRANYQSFVGAYAWFRTAIIGFFAALYGVVLYVTFGGSVNMSQLMPHVLGVFLIIIGPLMGKIRPNWFIGIRTPWTLSSKIAWVRTHRLGGWLFTALGVAFILATSIFGPSSLKILLVAIVGLVVTLAVYSWFVWKDDPEKVAPADTAPAGGDQD